VRGGGGGARLLHVQLGGGLGGAVAVGGDGRVEALRVGADADDDQRVAPALLQRPDVVAQLHRRV